MKTVSWSEAYALGIPSIDAQHKRLFDYFAQLDAAIAEGDRRGAKAIIDALIAYTVEHFAHEEALMISCGFPDQAGHIAAHNALHRRVVDFANRIDEHRDQDLLDFVSAWLVHHVGDMDRLYANHLLRMGVT